MSRLTSDVSDKATDRDELDIELPRRRVRRRMSSWGMGLLVVVTVIASYFVGLNVLDGYVFAEAAPQQPINFSHKIHATDNEIPCQFCHLYASRSFVAGIPSVQRCMGCHEKIRIDSPEIQKLHMYWEEQKPIPWVKVHDLPDYVQFPHKRHVRAGVDCQKDCHGPIATQAVVTKTAPLMMGWCLDCHRNKTFTGPDERVRQGPTDCWACHI